MIDAAHGRGWQDGLRAKMDRKLKMLSAQHFQLNNCTVSGLIYLAIANSLLFIVDWQDERALILLILSSTVATLLDR
jgi:hypothetical protein